MSKKSARYNELQKRFLLSLKEEELSKQQIQTALHNFITRGGEKNITKKQNELVSSITENIIREEPRFLPRDTISQERAARLREVRFIKSKPALRDPITFKFRTRGVETIRADKKRAGWSRAAVVRDPKTGRFKRWVKIS